MAKLFSTAVLTILITFAVWFLVKIYADNKPHDTRVTPFFTEKFDSIVISSGKFPPITKADFDLIVMSNPNAILRIPIQYTIDHQPVVFENESVDASTDGKGPIWKKPFSEIQKLDAGYKFKDQAGNFIFRGKGFKILHLEEIFKYYPKQRLILHLGQKYTELSQSVYDMIKEYNAFDRVIISCDFNQPLQYLRKFDPRIFTTASIDEVLRLASLMSVKLQGLDAMRADLFIVPLDSKGFKIFSIYFANEVHKRGKRVYVELDNLSDLSTIRNMGADGIITRFILDNK